MNQKNDFLQNNYKIQYELYISTWNDKCAEIKLTNLNYRALKMNMRMILTAATCMTFLAGALHAQGLAINSQSRLIGTPIHQTSSFDYYNCQDVMQDQNFITDMSTILTMMSTELNVTPPQNANCVVSQGKLGTFAQNSITMNYFIDAENARCFYANFCNDTRSATFYNGTPGVLQMDLTVINAARTMTVNWCASNSRGLIRQRCSE